jgi:hypothetical protein
MHILPVILFRVRGISDTIVFGGHRNLAFL